MRREKRDRRHFKRMRFPPFGMYFFLIIIIFYINTIYIYIS